MEVQPSYQSYRPKPPKQKKRKTKAILFGLFITAITITSLVIINKPDTTRATTKESAMATPSASKLKTISVSTKTTQLESIWKNSIDDATGNIAIAVFDSKSAKTAQYSNTKETFNTASVVKVSIAEALLLQSQNKEISLSDTDLANIAPMIEVSDNNTASTLWSEVGGKVAMDTFFTKIGASSTVSGSNGLWGLTQTTAMDQLSVVNAFSYPGSVLTNTSAATLNGFLDKVETDQTWGVSAGIPSTTNFELKDGWLEDSQTNDKFSDTTSWTVNSIGHVWDSSADYTIAVLTDGQTTEQSGINIIESLSTATWNVLSQ